MIPPQVRQRIGGRWAVSLPLYLAIAPVAIASNAVFLAADPTSRGVAATLGASLLSYLVMGLVLLACDRTVLRRRRLRAVPVVTVVLVGAAAGLARAVSAMALGQALGLPALSQADIASRVVAGVLLGGTLIPLGAYLMASIDDFRTQRGRLVNERIALQRAVLRDRERVTRLSDVIASAGIDPTALHQAADSLEAAVRADPGSTPQDQHLVVSQRLQELVATTVRPLSHRMMQAASPPHTPRLRFVSIVDAALRQRPFPIAMVLALWLVSAWPGEWARWGLASSILMLAIIGAITAVCFLAGRRLVRRWPAARYVAFVTVMLTVVALGSLVAWWVVPGMTAEQLASNAVATLVWLPVLTLVTSITTTALRQADAVIADLSIEVDQTQIDLLALESVEADQLRSLARYLHAEVQPRVLAAAWGVESSSQGDDSDLVLTVDDLARRLRQIDHDYEVGAARDMTLDHVADRWRGLVDVDIGSAPADSHLSTHVIEAIDEAVANAYRHGRASQVTVAAMRSGDALDIVVSDDGIGPRGGVAGMGSGIYSSACTRGWALEAGAAGGAVLTLRIGE